MTTETGTRRRRLLRAVKVGGTSASVAFTAICGVLLVAVVVFPGLFDEDKTSDGIDDVREYDVVLETGPAHCVIVIDDAFGAAMDCAAQR